MTPRIAIVGGSSRTGQAFRRLAKQRGLPVRILVRSGSVASDPETIVVADYFDPPGRSFVGIEVIINFAGITQGEDAALLNAVNGEGPIRLAAKAKTYGVRHFVHLSSFKVYGNAQEITRQTAEAPDTAYGRSKLKADKGLRELVDENFKVTILRLPALYGGGAGANLERIGRLMARLGFFPIPRRTIKRSVLHVDNLAVILAMVLAEPVNGTLIATDDEPLTLAALAAALGATTGRRPSLLALPDFAFSPMRCLLPGLYHRIYESKFVRPGERILLLEPLPISLTDGLIQLFKPSRPE